MAIGQVSLTLTGYDAARADAFLRHVAERVEGKPGVHAVSYADYVPLSIGAGSWEDLKVEGYAPSPTENMKLYRAVVSPNYFETMKVPIQKGRDFTLQDDSAHAPVMIVNETFVQRFLAGRSPVGVKVNGWGKWFTIVGVVRDSKILRLSEPAAPYFYVPQRQVYRPEYGYTFFVRTAGDVEQAATALRQAVNGADPSVPIFNAMPLADYIAAPLAGQRTVVQLLGILAAVAVLLAAIGLYGVISFAVTQRTREIGIRIAMGAKRADVLMLIGSQVAVLLIVGVLAGLGVATALARLAQSLLFAVSPNEPAVYATAAVGMMLVAAAAITVPALRATRVDPAITLRGE
ncbi:MAG: FtsX-like permease family protein [Longimicrobiales bacterium]